MMTLLEQIADILGDTQHQLLKPADNLEELWDAELHCEDRRHSTGVFGHIGPAEYRITIRHFDHGGTGLLCAGYVAAVREAKALICVCRRVALPDLDYSITPI